MVVELIIFGIVSGITAITVAGAAERARAHRALHPPVRGRKRSYLRKKLRLKPKEYPRRQPLDFLNAECRDPDCPHPPYVNTRTAAVGTATAHSFARCASQQSLHPLPHSQPLQGPHPHCFTQQHNLSAIAERPSVESLPHSPPAHSLPPGGTPQSLSSPGSVLVFSGPPDLIKQLFNGDGLGHQVHHGLGPATFAGNQWANTSPTRPISPAISPSVSMFTPSYIQVSSANVHPVQEAPKVQPQRYKKSSIRSRGRAARWIAQDSLAAANRTDDLQLRRWVRASTNASARTDTPSASKFARYDVKVEVPIYDDETYEKHLTDPAWSKEETSYLIDVYQECHGKWPVVIDHYSYTDPSARSMEDLKSRFYTISATLLQLNIPITSMTAPEYSLYETLKNFNPKQEQDRKELAEGHLKRRQEEVDEETVLLSELQRIMVNQATVDNEREDLRRRLDYPHANNGYQYSTSQALTGLWQQMLHADRMRKTQRLRPTGHPIYDGFGATPTSARQRESNVGLPDAANMSANSRRGTRDSLPSATTPHSALPLDLSKADQLRFGVVQNQDKLPSGVTFASDKLSKPRIAKSTVQTDKIATVLQHAGVPDLIPLPTAAVVEQFELIMTKVHGLLDLRKLKDKEEQEVRVREAEAGQ